jgi:glyoxylase-like metal-dependent hydrolase (beta-lactamase superfamily II)
LDYLVTIVGDGDTIDLGGRGLEVIEIPAHAPSSVAFLDKKERIMFTGDEVENYVMLYWMQDEPQPTIEQHARNMEKLLEYSKYFDFICGGHQVVMGDASMVEAYLDHDRQILAGLIEGEQLVIQMQAGGPAPTDFRMYQIEFKRRSVYNGTGLGYDCRYIRSK